MTYIEELPVLVELGNEIKMPDYRAPGLSYNIGYCIEIRLNKAVYVALVMSFAGSYKLLSRLINRDVPVKSVRKCIPFTERNPYIMHRTDKIIPAFSNLIGIVVILYSASCSLFGHLLLLNLVVNNVS